MQFKHVVVHQQEYQQALFNDDDPEADASFSLIILSCSKCHQRYFSNLVAAADGDEYAAMLSDVEQSLRAECPDHSHQFRIDTTVSR